MTSIYVSQAEWMVIAGDADAILTTVLGSCVACCLWDPRVQVGGMNHFLLPGHQNDHSNLAALSAGSTSMERLINECFKAGASREGLRARLFGGGSVVRRLSDVGARNAAFATGFLEAEGIPLVSASLGGNQARRIRFWPVGGMAQQRLVGHAVVEAPPSNTREAAGTLELF